MKILRVIDNEPYSSIKKILVGTSTINVYIFPREDLEKYMKNPMSDQQAVYMLYNETVSGNYHIYVGETEEIQKRLQQHNKAVNKSFWSNTIVIQDSCAMLNKAHFKYMEYMLYTYMKNAGRGTVVNSTVPVKPRLSEDDIILADEFIANVREVLQVFNIRFLEMPIIGNFAEDENVYFLDYNGCTARLHMIGKSEYILKSGSILIKRDERECPLEFKAIFEKRNTLIAQKQLRLIEGTNYYELLTDIKFDSEHEAAAFVVLECKDGDYLWKEVAKWQNVLRT